MGEIVGAALVSHVPTVVLPEAVRREMNDGRDTTLVEGLRRLKAEHLDRLRPDTIVVFDSHWFTTFEHVVCSHERRRGRFTSTEMPRTIAAVPYDMPGDPELAAAVAAMAAGEDELWVYPCADPDLAPFYGTINLLGHLQGPERWLSVSLCQTGTVEDFLRFGAVLGRAVEATDRRVVLVASGGLSHRFLPLRELRARESARLDNVATPEAVAADRRVLELLARGDHATVIEEMPSFLRHAPEGRFGHYLDLVGAIGGSRCTAPAEALSDYEASAGSGQIHLWFERPAGGWTA
jgi:3,4-dihydroxyphenylacetate 2,3-dioxygenase